MSADFARKTRQFAAKQVFLIFSLFAYETVAFLGYRYELLVSWSAHVEADGQHLLQSSYDQRGGDGVVLASTPLVLPLLVAT